MRYIKLLLIFIFSHSVFSQRTLTNPIILVHGWTGSHETWNEFTNYLETNPKLSIERSYLNFNLNCDYNNATSYLYTDVCNNTGTIGNKDVYIVNFNSGSSMSNQSAIRKQGYALKFAINSVLRATGAERVILLGHSMGGLAIREYLQNSTNWQPDGSHHIAKAVTIGTPHGGSNISGNGLLMFTKYDENSESVRDLRASYIYSNCIQNNQKIACPGVYLYGGKESKTWMITNIFGASNFYNLDVDCDGVIGNSVVGLNQKYLYTDLDYSCIIGGPTNDDVIVSTYSQNLNNFYSGLNAETFYYNCNGDVFCHTNEPKRAIYEMLSALDEPKKFLTKINFGEVYKGFFTSQSSGALVDLDEYTIVSQKGVITYSAGAVEKSNAVITIRDESGKVLSSENIGSGITKSFFNNSSGRLLISITGNSLGTWSTYSFTFSQCITKDYLTISSSGNTTICKGQTLTLTATAGFDSYKWFNGSTQLQGNINSIQVSESGTYSVQGSICGYFISSTGSTIVNVVDNPDKPTIEVNITPDTLILKSSSAQNNQWYLNGVSLKDATTQSIYPNTIGSYLVKVRNGSCESISDSYEVKLDKPKLKVEGNSQLCVGDSVKIIAPEGFGTYLLLNGDKESTHRDNVFLIKDSGVYRIKTKRGRLISALSDSVSLTFNPIPKAPQIILENNYLKSSEINNNQWYLNGIKLLNQTDQTLNQIGNGYYTVEVNMNGCKAISKPFVITAVAEYLDTQIKIYPNPNQGYFYFDIPENIIKFNIIVFNSLGEEIFTQKYFNISKVEMSLNIPDGTYHLWLISDHKSFHQKFIVYK